MNLQDPTERDLAAGEYVLGTLTAAEAGAVERELATDAALRDAVRYWEERLAGLADLPAPVEPSAALWDRIARDLPQATGAAVAPIRPKPWQRVGPWRAAAGLATAAAVALAVYLGTLLPTEEPAALTAVLQSGTDAEVGYLLEASADGALTLSPIGDLDVATDRSMELWTTDAAGTPVSLGILSPDESTAVPATDPPALQPGQIFMISLEQAGGSPTGQPQGPVVYQGRTFEPR